MKWNEKTKVLNCQTENGILIYIIEDNKICITGYEGTDSFLSVPKVIEEYPVCGIGKKAFLSNRSLQHIVLPETIEWIGDWAFCGCMQLRSVEFPYCQIRLGKGIFAKDAKLREIDCSSEMVNTSFSKRLMAAAVTLLEADYLLDIIQAGKTEWYEQLDNRLLTLLMEPVENALKDLVYCAEEDMGAKQEAHLAKQSRKKAYMALLRLAYPKNLAEETKARLTAYLLDKEGCQTEAAWEVIKESSGKEQLIFCNIMIRINGIREENFSAVLEDLGDTFVELKAYLLKEWEKRKGKTSVWEALVL